MSFRAVFLWGGLAVVVCWLPSGFLKALEAWLLSPHDLNSWWLLAWRRSGEYLVHALLMGFVSYSMMRAISVERGGQAEGSREKLESATDLGGAKLSGHSGLGLARRRSRLLRIVTAVTASLFLALLIEWGQALLPESFHRGFAWGDLLASVAGGLIGALAGLRVQLH